MPSRYALPAQPQGEKQLPFAVITAGMTGIWQRIFRTTPDWRSTCCRGLEPNGVPRGLAGTVQPFSFNRLDQLESIASTHELAAVKMEVQRSSPPDPGFLEGVREAVFAPRHCSDL